MNKYFFKYMKHLKSLRSLEQVLDFETITPGTQ